MLASAGAAVVRAAGAGHAGCGKIDMDTTVKKIDSASSPRGPAGERHLASGKGVAMRLWDEEPGEPPASAREYETVGYVVRGRATLEVGDQQVTLEAGDSWLVPAGTEHRYRIHEPFQAIEATSPPAHVHGRDEAPD